MRGSTAGSRTGSRAILALALVAGGSLTLAPAASAGKLSTATRTVSVTGIASTGSVRATCPGGTKAFAGGFKTSAPTVVAPAPPSTTPAAQDLLVVNESRRSGVNGWRVTASQLGTGTGTLTAVVYCHAAKVKQVATTIPLAAAGRSEATANAACPNGTSLVSGGYTLPVAGSQSQFAFATQNVLAGSRRWSVHGVRGSGSAASPGSVIAYAYCAPGKRLRLLAKTVSGVTNPTANPLISAEAGPCAKGVVSGGFKAPYTQNASTRETIFVTQSLLTKTGWQVSGQPFGTTGLQVNLSAFALCK